jgi:DNA-binding response OmpR family regulator
MQTADMQKQILIVDDDEDDCDLFIDAAHVVDSELVIDKIFTVRGAMQLLREGYHPDFIFLDLNLPIVDGGTCLKEIREINSLSDVPVIIYSTSKRQSDEDRLSGMGADYFLTKPSSLEELCSEITFILSSVWRKTSLSH